MPAVYATFRMNPRRRAKPRANSSAPIVVTKKPGFALTVWLQKPNHGCSQLGCPARVRDHLSQRVGEARLELERSIDEPDHAEDHSHRGLQGSQVPHEPVVEEDLDGCHGCSPREAGSRGGI